VRKLDGIPLAIELCAARVGLLGLEQLVEALDAPLEVLAAGPAAATGRIATLRGAIDASWLSLEPRERQALAQWSVFRGGFDLAAATAVLELSPGSTDVGPLAILQSLHDKSLLRAYDAPDLSGERRYTMFESIREYAGAELELSGAADATRQRHAAYFVAEGGGWAAAVEKAGGSRALTRLAVETSNLLAAHAWMLSSDRPLEALAAMLALEPVFSTRGPLARYAELLGSALLAAAVERAPAAVVARAHLARGYALCRAQRVAEGIADLDRAVTVAEQLGEVALIARARSEAGMGRARAGAEQVEEDFRCALEALEQVEDEWTRAVVLDNVGAYLQMRGRGDEARARFEEAVAAFRAAGCERREGRTLGNVAGLCLEAGQLEAAANDFRRALDLLRPFHEKRLEGWVLVGLGALELELAHLDEARAHLRAAIALNRDTGARQWEALAETYLGHVELEAGRPATAREHYGDSLALLGELGYERQLGVTRVADSAAAALVGQLDEAATGFREAEEILNRAGRPSDALVLALMRRHLDLASARRDELTGDVDAARSQRDAVRAHLATLDQRALRADEVRFARRTLDSALRARDAATSPIGGSASEQAPAPWIVRLDGSELQTPSGERVSLGRRGTLRRLLHELIEQRLHAPGQALSMQRAIETGWPGQKMDWDAGANRVRVAMSTLRKLGLRSVLIGRDDGYLLDPSAAIIAEEDSPPA
jgi:tetratricopeptide (TPR) repeat protein